MNKIFSIFILLIVTYAINSKANQDDIYVNSENIQHDKNSNIIYLAKDSFINYQSVSIRTDEGMIDTDNKKIIINGNFYLDESGDIMKGESLKADLNFNVGTAKNVNYLIQNKIKINSKNLNKKKDVIIFRDNFITPCDLKGIFNCPTWSLKVKKTKYTIDDDFFQHFSTFVQIADKKLFYLPYLSHYGSKASRKKGFLTPSMEFSNLKYGSNLTLPYYLPLNVSTDLKITPTFYYYGGSYIKYFKSKIEYKKKISEGDIAVNFENYYDRRLVGNIKKGYSVSSSSELNLNKNNNINMNLNYTTSVSKYKSISDSRASSLNSTMSLKTYNFIHSNDLLISKISSAKTLTGNNDTTSPYELPSLRYLNYINLKNNLILNNDIKIDVITRSLSAKFLPNKILRANVLNKFQKNLRLNNNYKLINKLILNTTSISVDTGKEGTHNKSGNSNQITAYASGELNKIIKFKNDYRIKPRVKMILASKSTGNNLNVNDNSQSLSFNYNNLFQENRFFGSDIKENSTRIAASIEQNYNLYNEIDFGINYGRSYNINNGENLMENVNQKTKLSDHLTEISISYKNNKMKYNSRYNKNNFSLKEDFLSYELNNEKNSLVINKNITSTCYVFIYYQ